jgi:hypothetical protein
LQEERAAGGVEGPRRAGDHYEELESAVYVGKKRTKTIARPPVLEVIERPEPAARGHPRKKALADRSDAMPLGVSRPTIPLGFTKA